MHAKRFRKEGSTISLSPRLRRRRTTVRVFRLLVLVAVLSALYGWVGPWLLSPTADFAQGPGGVAAFVSLSRQLQQQNVAFAAGRPVTIHLTAEEFDGLLASALLSGRRPTDPLRKVRSRLQGGQVVVETVMQPPAERVPKPYQGPMGLTLGMKPAVNRDGSIQLQIAQAYLGRVPLPLSLIPRLSKRVPLPFPGFDPEQVSVTLPLSELVSQQMGRHLTITTLQVTDDGLTLQAVRR